MKENNNGHLVPSGDSSQSQQEFFRYLQQGDYPALKDVILVENMLEGDAISIVELFRFDDEGNRRISYRSDKIILGNGKQYLMRLRAASFAGMMRLLETRENLVKGREVVVIRVNEQKHEIGSQYAKLHAEK